MTEYIVASSKPWHRDKFDQVADGDSSKWAYVADSEELAFTVAASRPRYIFFLHWNWKVPRDIWQAVECICFHMTDVPYGRGGSPLQNLIIAGKRETMVTALRMVEEMDAGPVYAKQPLSLEGRAEEIYQRTGEICWKMIGSIIAHQPVPLPQVGEPTLFKRRKPEQSRLPVTGSLPSLYDFIRMLDAPTYPLAFIEHGDYRIEFSHAYLLNGEVKARVTIRKRDSNA